MMDIAQSQFLALVAGAVLASSLLGVGAYENARSEDLAVVGALDALALRVGLSGCGPTRPNSTLDLAPTWQALPAAGVSLALYPDHVRATREGLPALSSVGFPPLVLAQPLELPRGAGLWLRYVALEHACAAGVVQA
jgi:hypothetical protein